MTSIKARKGFSVFVSGIVQTVSHAACIHRHLLCTRLSPKCWWYKDNYQTQKSRRYMKQMYLFAHPLKNPLNDRKYTFQKDKFGTNNQPFYWKQLEKLDKIFFKNFLKALESWQDSKIYHTDTWKRIEAQGDDLSFGIFFPLGKYFSTYMR